MDFRFDLQAAVEAFRPPPCERPVRCRHWDRCAKEKLACDVFAAYVNGGRSSNQRNPSHAMYKRVMATPPTETLPLKVIEQKPVEVPYKAPRTVSDHTLTTIYAWWIQGVTPREIGQQIGRNENTIKSWLAKVKNNIWQVDLSAVNEIAPPDLSENKLVETWAKRSVEPELLRQIKELSDQGVRICDIAEQLGRPAKTIGGWLRNIKVGRWTLED